jgi:hypothetical protein
VFKRSDKTLAVPQTAAQLAAKHRRRAERLMRNQGVGHDQMMRVAAQASAHASMAIMYQLMPEPMALLDDEDSDAESN